MGYFYDENRKKNKNLSSTVQSKRKERTKKKRSYRADKFLVLEKSAQTMFYFSSGDMITFFLLNKKLQNHINGLRTCFFFFSYFTTI
jgi:hypothetical protein